MSIRKKAPSRQNSPSPKPKTAYARQIAIMLHDGHRIVFSTKCKETDVPFSGMEKLLCLDEESWQGGILDVEFVYRKDLPACRHPLKTGGLTEIAYTEDWRHVLIAGWKREPHDPMYYRNYLWQMALVYGCMNSLLHGGSAVLVHCAVLETSHGAVLLFGESGMGKSTAFKRWRRNGGKGASDDMALLDFSRRDGIFVRRMPTWSACRQGTNEWDYPVREELQLAGVLALGRSESGHDELVPIQEAQFFAQCYRSMFYWFLYAAEALPEIMKERLAHRVRIMTEKLAGMIPPRALLTALDGNLTDLFKELL